MGGLCTVGLKSFTGLNVGVICQWILHLFRGSPPVYPDGDPLTIKIVLGGMDINNIVGVNVVPLFDIHPSRIAVEIDSDNDCMYMLRIDGMDTMPTN